MRSRKTKTKSRFGFLAGVVAGLLLSLAGLMAAWRVPPPALAPGSDPAVLPGVSLTDPMHILVLGVDEREGDTGRSDSMMLVRVAEGAPVRVLAIPRDTLVKIDGHGEGKANSAYTYGGPELAKQAVSKLVGLPVDHYVLVNMAGFRHLVDLMGGVEIDVPKPMHYEDPTDGLKIDLAAGPQRLDGSKAEQFVRFRHDAIGDDVGRIHRQHEFLKAASAQMLAPSNLARLPKLVYTASSYVETDLPVSRQVSLAYSLYSAQQRSAILQETLPGRGDYVNGISFFLPDRKALMQLISLWAADLSAPRS